MIYICITHIDSATGTPCTEAPMRNGPEFPLLSGFVYKWENQSEFPILCSPDGSYITAPKYYGACDNDADTTVSGVLEVLTEDAWNAAKDIEIEARRPFASWVWDEIDQLWKPPFPRPGDAVINGGAIRYQWDESIVNWAAI